PRHASTLSLHDALPIPVASEYPATAELPDGTYELSLQWTALTPGKTPGAIFAVNRATDWESFRAGATLFEVPSQNLVYADVDGRSEEHTSELQSRENLV